MDLFKPLIFIYFSLFHIFPSMLIVSMFPLRNYFGPWILPRSNLHHSFSIPFISISQVCQFPSSLHLYLAKLLPNIDLNLPRISFIQWCNSYPISQSSNMIYPFLALIVKSSWTVDQESV